MSRWDAVIKLLPRPLRSAKLLDAVDKLDREMLDSGAKGSFAIEAHYAIGGEPQTAKIVRPNSEFDLKK